MSSFIILLATLSAGLYLWTRRPSGRKLPLPPGPPGLPIIGNALDMPPKLLGPDYRLLNEKYGDLVYLNVVGQPILVVGSLEIAVDLLEKRSSIYSGRATSPIVQMGGFDWILSSLQYGLWWRRNRRAFHQFFNPNAVTQFRPVQRTQIHQFLGRLLESPGEFTGHIKHLFAATILKVTYGIELMSENDEYAKLAQEGIEAFSRMLVPGKYLVETFPILRHVPSWVPGAQFKRDAEEAKEVVLKLRDLPWARTLAAMREGIAKPSMTTTLMERVSMLEGKEAEEEEIIARNTAAVAYGAGADTTLSSIQAFFLILALYPEVHEKARAELDAVVGQHRLPEFADQTALPYVSAVAKECLRWHVIAPLGLAHRSSEDDEYRGYFIPAGTLVMPNAWAFTRNEKLYPNPEVFMPERFLKDGKLNPDVTDPSQFVFGYGRRICPGRHFAESSLFLVVSSVLHVFDVSAPLDENGVPVKLEGKVTGGLISYPEPFECVIKPRAPWAEALVRAHT
ncbi:CyP450 monooxygenase [Trametes gibbosa]|nr:CyP450 monooxygenase [Trametes gibbosa]